MFHILIALAVGAFIGWNVKQPTWAANIQAKVEAFFKSKF